MDGNFQEEKREKNLLESLILERGILRGAPDSPPFPLKLGGTMISQELLERSELEFVIIVSFFEIEIWFPCPCLSLSKERNFNFNFMKAR